MSKKTLLLCTFSNPSAANGVERGFRREKLAVYPGLKGGACCTPANRKKRAGAFAAARLAVLKKQFDRGDENQCLNDVFKQLLRHFPQ